MPWSHDEQMFERWRDGKTGMPLVDANMRELKQTGKHPACLTHLCMDVFPPSSRYSDQGALGSACCEAGKDLDAMTEGLLLSK